MVQNRQRQMELQNDAAGAASFGAAPSREREEEAQPAESSRRCKAFCSVSAWHLPYGATCRLIFWRLPAHRAVVHCGAHPRLKYGHATGHMTGHCYRLRLFVCLSNNYSITVGRTLNLVTTVNTGSGIYLIIFRVRVFYEFFFKAYITVKTVQ